MRGKNGNRWLKAPYHTTFRKVIFRIYNLYAYKKGGCFIKNSSFPQTLLLLLEKSGRPVPTLVLSSFCIQQVFNWQFFFFRTVCCLSPSFPFSCPPPSVKRKRRKIQRVPMYEGILGKSSGLTSSMEHRGEAHSMMTQDLSTQTLKYAF